MLCSCSASAAVAVGAIDTACVVVVVVLRVKPRLGGLQEKTWTVNQRGACVCVFKTSSKLY